MLGLVPRDHWEHHFSDLFLGLLVALGLKKIDEMLNILELGSCIPVRSGRAGLVTAIKALQLKPGTRIGVPLYCCHVVFKAIIASGGVPCFIDVDPETFCISLEGVSEKLSQIDAVVAVHMFGNLCDMPGLKEAAQGRPIIEDCAQSLGSKINGHMAGSFSDIAFFSFRSGKNLSVGEGGALFSREAALASWLSRFTAELDVPSRAEECVHVAKTYIKSVFRSKPFYGVMGYSLWGTLNKKMNLSEKSGIALSQIHRSDLTIIKKRLLRLDSAIATQRANADFYSRALKVDPGMLCSEKPGSFYNRYHYPITFPSQEHRDFIADYLFNRQIDTMKYLDHVVDIAVKNYGYVGDCPVAERLSKRVLIIPSYYSLKKKDVQRIAQCLNAGWQEAKKSGTFCKES